VIQDTARTVPPGQAFRLRNTFQPFPLYGVLGAKGFAHWVEELGPDDWLITFYRERQVSADADADDTHPHGATRPETMPSAADVGVGAVGVVPAGAVDIEHSSQPSAAAEPLVAAGHDRPDDLPADADGEGAGGPGSSAGRPAALHHLRTPYISPRLRSRVTAIVSGSGPDRKEILTPAAE
jgi:hypothetical protein